MTNRSWISTRFSLWLESVDGRLKCDHILKRKLLGSTFLCDVQLIFIFKYLRKQRAVIVSCFEFSGFLRSETNDFVDRILIQISFVFQFWIPEPKVRNCLKFDTSSEIWNLNLSFWSEIQGQRLPVCLQCKVKL